jgi:putative DNA primase/helicase
MAEPTADDAAGSEHEAESALREVLASGLTAIQQALASAETYAPEDLKLSRLDKNDLGNAQRFVARNRDSLVFMESVGWHAWEKTHWSREAGDAKAKLCAMNTVEAMKRESLAVVKHGRFPRELPPDFEKRVAHHVGWARQSGNAARMAAMVSYAEPLLWHSSADFDRHHMLFNCANGTLDLSDPARIRLRRHRQEDLLTQVSPVRYSPRARCPKFEAFLMEILPDRQVQLFMQQWAGYSLTGDTSAQVLVLMWGTGANGKSTLDGVLRHIFGNYAATVQFTSLLRNDSRRGDSASPDLARLRGVRAAFASEPEQSVQFSEGLIKSLTGGEPITTRHLHQNFFEYIPLFKLWLAFNHKPFVRGTDTGIWRRLLLVPFTVTIPPERRNLNLLEELKAEAPGILNWMLDGYRSWRDRGLCVPEAVRAATDEYRDETDVIGRFIADALEVDPSSRVQAKQLFECYLGWCRANVVNPQSQTAFGRRMATAFEKLKDNVLFYVGIRVRPEWLAGRKDGSHSAPPAPPYEDSGEPF